MGATIAGVQQHLSLENIGKRPRDAERGQHLQEPHHGRILPVGGRPDQHDQRLMAVAPL